MATCKFCGEPNLVWDQTDFGWKLMNLDGSKHVCPIKEKPEAAIGNSKGSKNVALPKELLRWFVKLGEMKLQWYSMKHKCWINVPVYGETQASFADAQDADETDDFDVPF